MEPSSKNQTAKNVSQNVGSDDSRSKSRDIMNECYMNKDYKRFLNLSDEWLRKNNSSLADPIFFVRRAHSFYTLGLYDQAISNAEKATCMDPRNPFASGIIGFSQSQLMNSLAVQQDQRPVDVQQKIKLHLQLSLSSLLKAKNLDSAIAESPDFKLSWDTCMREFGRQVKLPGFQSQQAEPFLARIKSGGDKALLRPLQWESDDVLHNRSADMCLHVFQPDDSVIVKSEMLFLLVRLSAECLNPHHSMRTWDSVRNVRVLFEYQNALTHIEQKLAYDSQVPSWQIDRQAWRLGVATATTPGAILALLRILHQSLRPWALEKKPERVTQQVRMVLTDLEAFGDEGLGSAFAGECQRVRLALVTLAIRELENDMACDLMIEKARILESDRCYAESIRLLNDVVSFYNMDECSETVMRVALEQRDLIRDKLSLPEQQSLALVNPKQTQIRPLIMTSLGSAPGMVLTGFSGLGSCSSFEAKSQAEQDLNSTDSMNQWKSLDAKQKTNCAEITLGDLKSRLGPALMETLRSYLDSLGKKDDDILEAYSQLPSKKNGENKVEFVKRIGNLSNGLEPELRGWSEFQSALNHLLLKTLVLHQLLDEQTAKSQETIPTIQPFNGRLSSLPLCPNGVMSEKLSLVSHLLSQRQAFPGDFSNEAVCDGWQPRISRQLQAKYASQSSVGDVSNMLLFEDVYFVLPLGQDEPYSNGLFVSELCARTCHADRKRVYVGRLPFASECREDCKVQRGPVCLKMNLTRTIGNSLSISNVESILQNPPRRGLHSVLRDMVLREEAEAKVIEKYLAAHNHAENAENIIGRLEQAKWAAEQVVDVLDRFSFLNKLVVEDPYDARDVRFAEEAMQAAVDLMELWEAEGIDPKTQFPSDVYQALLKCASLLAFRRQVRGKLQDARASLLIEEENLASALPAADPDWIEDVHSIQVELAKDEKLQKLHANVVSLTQTVSLLGSQLTEVESHLRALCIMTIKKYQQHIRWSALMEMMTLSPDALEDLLSDESMHASAELQQTIAAIRQAHIQTANGPMAISMHERVNVAEAAIRLLQVLPESLPEHFVQWNDVDEAWIHFDQAGDQVRTILSQMCASISLNLQVDSPQLAQTIGVGRLMASILTEMLSREWPQYVEFVAHERWRRGEVMKLVHLKIQALYFAIGEVVWERLEELKSIQAQDAVLRELLDEEERLLKEKASKASKKKSRKTEPQRIVTTAKSPVEDGKQVREEVKPELQLKPTIVVIDDSTIKEKVTVLPDAAAVEELKGTIETPNGQIEDDASEWITVGKKSSVAVGKTKKNKNGAISASSDANGGPATSTLKPSKSSTMATKQQKVSSHPMQNGHSAIRKQEKKKSSKLDHSEITEVHDGLKHDRKSSSAEERHPVNGIPAPLSESVVEETTASTILINLEGQSTTPVENDSNAVKASGEAVNHGAQTVDMNGYAEMPVQDEVEPQMVPEQNDTSDVMVVNGENDRELRVENLPLGNGEGDISIIPPIRVHEGHPMLPHPSNVMPPLHPSLLRRFPAHPSWICPLSGEVMMNPVTAADGCNYDQYAIMAWLSTSRVSPVSGAPLAHDNLVPNFALRQTICEAMARYMSSPAGFGMPPVPPPMRPVCIYFQKGTCRYGAGCHNLHVPPLGLPLIQSSNPPSAFGTAPPPFAMAPPFPHNISTVPPPFLPQDL